MKHFAELLALTLVGSILILIYCLIQILLEAARIGILTPIITGYIFGFLSPLIIATYLMRGSWEPYTMNTTMNTCLDRMRWI